MNKIVEKMKKDKVAVNTRTKVEYDELMRILEKEGIKWGSGVKPTEKDYYKAYRSNTCMILNFGDISFADVSLYKEHGYRIIPFKKLKDKAETFTKADLKDGDLLTLRNGEKGWYSKDMILSGLDASHINNDLTNSGRLGKPLDIVKVERPLGYETIFERKEEILDDKEKEYLRAVIKPFRKNVKYVMKNEGCQGKYIEICLNDVDSVMLPYFKNKNMYKGMKVDTAYTLEELGL